MITDFDAALAKFSEIIGVDLEDVVTKVVFDLWGGITKRTPVDTGRARSSWQITTGSPSSFTPPEVAEGQVLGPPTPPAVEISVEEITYISSALPYIEPLENGHSKQAPAGMVAVTLLEVKAEIDAAMAGA